MMLRDELLQDDEIKRFVKKADFSERALNEFLEEHVQHPDHHVEFMNQVTRNVVALSAPKLPELSRPKQFYLLKAIAKLMDAAMWLKTWEYHLSRSDGPEYWKGLPLPFFMPLSGMIEPLESMRWALRRIDPRYGTARVLLVEGESEATFVRTVQWLTRAANFDVPLYVYGGKGEVQNLVHLITDRNAAGVGVYLSYDTDGKSEGFLRTLRRRNCRLTRRFGFSRDFEGAFPPEMLATAVGMYAENVAKAPLRVSASEVRTLLQDPKPFAVALKEKFGLSLTKPRFATILGTLISKDIELHWHEAFNRRAPRKAFRYEAYKFLRFIMS